MLAYNSSVYEITGVTPAIAMFGRELRLPEYIWKNRERIDRVHELVRDHLKTQQRLQKCLHDRHANETHIRQNDRVWLAVPRNFG
ncbi:hypothetical protein T09_9577 [Trichinella sp. T9]|nr:hypothetical protein T09_9577 [Trichinella sp. T9]